MKGTTGIGLIGTGGVATLHANAVAAVDGLHVAGAFSRDPEKLGRFVGRQGGRAFGSRQELLRDDDVDVVSVCVPYDRHVPFALEALRAGKHVVLEKPVAATIDEIDLLQREAERAGRLCMPCHNYVYAPQLVRGRELAREGRFGRLANFWLIYNQKHDADAVLPATVMRELCIHHAYVVLFFLGRPSSVAATVSRIGAAQVDDQIMMVFKMPDGVIANVWGSFAADDRTSAPWGVVYKLLGTKGGFTYTWHDADFGDAPQPGWDRAAYHDSFRHVYRHLAARCLAAGEPPLSTLADARDALCLIEAAERAQGSPLPIAYR